MTITVLFLCPHNAAKSVAAAAFASQVASREGLDLHATTAGTDPDAEVLPVVRARLEADGLAVTQQPRLITAAELLAADVVVNIGCDVDELPAARPVEDWQIPNFSDDPPAAFAALEQQAAALVARLVTSGNEQ